MPEIRFTKARPECCPSYKGYYIQDRAVGRNVYGHESYEYALFRRRPFQVIRRFRRRKQAYEYVRGLTGLDRWDVRMGSSRIVANGRYYLGVLHGETMLRIDKRTREVSARPIEDEQISGWFERYTECLAAAKKTVERLEMGPGEGGG